SRSPSLSPYATLFRSRRQQFRYKRRICEVHRRELRTVQMEGDDARNHHEKRHEYFQEPCEQSPFLALGQTLGTKCPLYCILVGTPVEQVGEDHTGEYRTERHTVISRADRVQLLRTFDRDRLHPLEDVAVAKGDEAEYGHNEADDEESDAVQCIGNRNRLETAENCVA